jgi:hypothetical protein
MGIKYLKGIYSDTKPKTTRPVGIEFPIGIAVSGSTATANGANTSNTETFEFDEFKGQKWSKIKLKENRVILSPCLFIHRASGNTQWRDTLGISEDVDFNKRLRAEYTNGTSFERPTYVRCHYTDKWDV